MLCEAALAVAALVAVEEGWAVLESWLVAAADAPVPALAALAGLVAFVAFMVAPPCGATTADSLYCDWPSRTVMLTLSAVIVVPKVPAFPPRPATAADRKS